jgi:hypothetical protein
MTAARREHERVRARTNLEREVGATFARTELAEMGTEQEPRSKIPIGA